MTAVRKKPISEARLSRQREAASKLAAIKRESLAKWRAWAKAMSAGEPAPDPVQILSVGAILQIESPMNRLALDADAVGEFTQCEKNAALCRATTAERLSEFGGKPEAIDAAIVRLEAELVRLRNVRSEVVDGCSEGFWTNRIHELRRAAPLALGYDDDQADA